MEKSQNNNRENSKKDLDIDDITFDIDCKS